ncbi:MAG: hypothetical protein LBG67_04770 [Campylobacteraceae bacterium]|jgi:hypothetical protein|nr:hypothetical protein [Campylobacteraceae bacterium]
MAYVNEEISKEDYEKYNLAEIKERTGYYGGSRWAIDRERWLRYHIRLIDTEDSWEEIWIKWHLYYKGYLVSVKTKDIEKKFNREKKELYIYKKILELEIPKEIEDQKEQILKDLKEAFEESCGDPYLVSYMKDKGNTCKIDLEYNGEII